MKTGNLVIVALLLLFAGCVRENRQDVLRTVKTLHPVSVNEETFRTLPGIVKEKQQINLGFKTAGQIERIYVKAGDYVGQGQLIAKLDDKDYNLQLSATQIQYDQLKTEVERLEELYRRNSLPANDYEKASAGLKAMQVQLDAHTNVVNYTVLRAPVAGYIESVNYSPSELVDAGMPVVSLIDISSVVVEADIPVSLYLLRDNFNSIKCIPQSYPGEEIDFKILSVNHKSSGNQLYKMQLIPVSQTNNKLVAGMNVKVKISVGVTANENECLLPVNCVFTENERSYVWRYNPSGSVVNRVEVEVRGIDDKGRLIVSGIHTNDNIVSAGIQFLQENERVKLIQETSNTNVGGLL